MSSEAKGRSDGLLPPRGSRIVVAGGCGGIGRAFVASALAAELDVTVIDLPRAADAYPQAGATMIAADLSQRDGVETAFATVAARHDAIDGFVNLTGFTNSPAAVADIDPDRWDEAIDGNLRAVFLACRSALPLLRASGKGAMVIASSGQGVRPLSGFGPYGVAKAGVIALARSIALENAPLVRANVIAPGAVRTAFLTGGTARPAREGDDVDTKAARYGAAVPMGRIAEPEEVADPILFLLGPGARFITGQVLHVNGGGLMA